MRERDNRGRFVKSTKKKGVLSAGVMGAVEEPEIPTENKNKRKDRNIQYIKFGDDNLFPQAVALLSRRSAAHRGILNFKNMYICGNQIATDEADTALQQYISDVNATGESQKEVLDKVWLDYNMGGNGYLELVTDQNRSFLNQFHKDWTKIRIKKGGESVLIHPDWNNYSATKDDVIEIPLYPNFAEVDGRLRSIVHFKAYEPEFDHYGIPTWISALDAAGIAYKTNKWNISRLDNSFNSSGVLLVDGDLSEQDAAELKKDFEDEFTGEGKTGKVLMMVKALGGGGSTFTPITSTTEGDWIQLHNQSKDELIIAHSWFRSLSAVGEAGQLGNTQQMRNEYQAAHNTVIPYTRSKILPKLKNIISRELGLDTSSMEIQNIPNLSMMDLLNANKFTKIWEARKEAGLDYDMEDPTQDVYIENNIKEVSKDGTADNGSAGS